MDAFKPGVVYEVAGAPAWQLVIKDVGGDFVTHVVHKLTCNTFCSTSAKDCQRDLALMMNMEKGGEEAEIALKTKYMKCLMWCKGKRAERKRADEAKVAVEKAESGTPKATTAESPTAAKGKKDSKVINAIKHGKPTPQSKGAGSKEKVKLESKSALKAATKATAPREKEAGEVATDDPEPQRGSLGSHHRAIWNMWKERQLDRAKKTSSATVKPQVRDRAGPAPQPSVRKPVNKISSKAQRIGKREDKNSLVTSDFIIATRAPSKTAKGAKRRVSKGKTASLAVDDIPPKKKKKTKAEDMPRGGSTILPGAETLFHAQRVGSRGLREASRKHAHRSSIVPSDADLKSFRRMITSGDHLIPGYEDGLKIHLRAGAHWLWHLQLDFNILLFGVGCKERMLSTFARDFLSGEDVLTIDGARVEMGGTGTRTVRALLDTIAEQILQQPSLGFSCMNLDSYTHCIKEALQRHYNRLGTTNHLGYTSSVSHANTESVDQTVTALLPISENHAVMNEAQSRNNFDWSTFGGTEVRLSRSASTSSVNTLEIGEADQNWGGRFTNAKAKLYLLVHSIDGEALQSKESQRVLASLCDCPSFALVASCDKVNAPLLWSNDLLNQFRWSFQHAPTYVPYSVSTRFTMLKGQKGVMSHNQGLEYILGSLTNRHKELLVLLAHERLKALNTNEENVTPTHYKGMNFDELLAAASKAMIVQQANALSAYLKELEDHRLVSVSSDSQKKKFILIMLASETLTKLVSV